ncbi:MAG: hypothetical protein WDW38_010905 [Sanguina aurantia]
MGPGITSAYQAATTLLHARLLNARHLASEFQLVQELDLNIPHDCADAQLSHNKGLNRYFNVLPYDHNRVHLQGRSSSTGDGRAAPRQQQQQQQQLSSSVQSPFSSTRPGPGPSDNSSSRYINASLVQHDGGQAVYIATQGPLDSTTPDFWQMVWEQQCPAIVMLTRFEERGNVKCGSYLPVNESETRRAGHFEVTNIGQQQLFAGHLIRRQLQISDLRRSSSSSSSSTGTQASDAPAQQPTLTVQHFQYTAWPDHGTPKDSHAIRFICDAVQQLVRQPSCAQACQPAQGLAPSEPAARNTTATARATSEPAPASPPAAVVVHCSAGIGRSGTFVAIDVMRQRLCHLQRAGAGPAQAALEQALDLPALVHDMRQQRMGMVQTSEQYQYVYRALLEELRDLTGETAAGAGAGA